MLHVGIDLHGTLITDHPEEVSARALPRLLAAMSALRGRARLYACTGNDLGFIQRKLPAEVLALLDGAVLETGCVASDLAVETVLVDEPALARIRRLEQDLRECRFDWLYKFARRLATISMFTRLGLRAADFRDEVQQEVNRLGADSFVKVTYSSVAVDIIPIGFNKLHGLRRLAGSEMTVGVADSMNDLELVRGADFAFLPANCSRELLENLRLAGRPVQKIGEASALHPNVAVLCSESFTDGVSQALDFLVRNL
jgi:hypothetical protein